MKDIEIGQVLSLRIRFNNSGTISSSKHPYLVIDINEEFDTLEIAQIDSLAGKEYKAAKKSNKTIFCDNPLEKVIDKDSYIQLDNTFYIEYFDGLSDYRRQADKLSTLKLCDVISAYREYHEKYSIDEDKQVFMDKNEIVSLNS